MQKGKKEILEHLLELRNRIIFLIMFFFISFFICYYYSTQIYNFLLYPLEKNLIALGLERKLIYTGLGEAFSSYIKLSFFISIFMVFPYINWHLYRFISPALYKKERKFFYPLLIVSPMLFYIGCFFAYYFVFPLAWKFFLSFETHTISTVPIELQAKISEYLSLSMRIIIAFGLVFQLPVILIILLKTGIVSKESLRKKRKYAFLLFFIIGAVITPPDIISQIAIALPMYLLFEVTLLFAPKK